MPWFTKSPGHGKSPQRSQGLLGRKPQPQNGDHHTTSPCCCWPTIPTTGKSLKWLILYTTECSCQIIIWCSHAPAHILLSLYKYPSLHFISVTWLLHLLSKEEQSIVTALQTWKKLRSVSSFQSCFLELVCIIICQFIRNDRSRKEEMLQARREVGACEPNGSTSLAHVLPNHGFPSHQNHSSNT